MKSEWNLGWNRLNCFHFIKQSHRWPEVVCFTYSNAIAFQCHPVVRCHTCWAVKLSSRQKACSLVEQRKFDDNIAWIWLDYRWNMDFPIKPAPLPYHSSVWKQFRFPEWKDELDVGEKSQTVCKHCRTHIWYRGNTTNMSVHLHRHHPRLLVDSKELSPTPLSSDSSPPAKSMVETKHTIIDAF